MIYRNSVQLFSRIGKPLFFALALSASNAGMLQTVDASEPRELSLDTSAVKILMAQLVVFRHLSKPSGLLVFRFVDSESLTEIDSVDVHRKIRNGTYVSSHEGLRPSWQIPGNHSFKIYSSGYVSLFVKNIRVPTDSAVIVTIRMKKGKGEIEANGSGDSLIQVSISTLDGTFPRNEVAGVIIDESDGLPVSGATVYCEETDQTVITDSTGRFSTELYLLKSATLNTWHPHYDSIRFEVRKRYVRTQKDIEIHFQAQRLDENGEKVCIHNDSTVLLLVDMMDWSSWRVQPSENLSKIYTYEVHPGEEFGPQSKWSYYETAPFRLVRLMTKEAVLIQFSKEFGMIMGFSEHKMNPFVLTDTTIRLNSNSDDGGTTVSLSIQPEYSPRDLNKK